MRIGSMPPARGKLTWANLRGAAVLAYNVLVEVGLQVGLPARRSGAPRATRCAAARSTRCSAMGFMAYHLIQFTREALRGDQNASFYSTRQRERAAANAGLARARLTFVSPHAC